MHELGVEYTEAIAVLLKRISSRMWDRDISENTKYQIPNIPVRVTQVN